MNKTNYTFKGVKKPTFMAMNNPSKGTKEVIITMLFTVLLFGCTVTIIDESDDYPYPAQRCHNCYVKTDLCPKILLEDASYAGCTGIMHDDYGTAQGDYEYSCERSDLGHVWRFTCDFTGK